MPSCQSDWYRERMRVKQERDTTLWRRHVAALEKFQQAGIACEFDVEERTREARVQFEPRQFCRLSE